MNYWLLKSEPENYSIDDLAKERRKTTPWDGVRNYQARNLLRDELQVGDRAFFYHSGENPPGIVGLCEVVSTPYPDPTQFDLKSKYFDDSSPADNPRWICVDVRLIERFPTKISLDELRGSPSLEGLELLRRGSRLSVQPVSPKHFASIMKMVGDRPMTRKR